MKTTTTVLCLHSNAEFRTSLLRTARLSDQSLFVSCVETYRLAQVFFGQSKKYDVVICEMRGEEDDSEILGWMQALSYNGTELILLVPEGGKQDREYINHVINTEASMKDQLAEVLSILTGEH